MQILFNIILSWSVIFIVSLSFYLIFKPTKIFHISHAFTISLAAYSTYFFLSQGWLGLLVYILALFLSVIFGILNEVIFYRHLRSTKNSNLNMLVLSLGVYIVFQNLLSMTFGDEIKNLTTTISERHHISGVFFTQIQIISILSAVSILSFTLFLWHKTRLGKAIRAISENPELSRVIGIPRDRIILIAFGIGSAYAGVAGILVGLNTGITPTMGFPLLLYGIVAMIIGGLGSIWGIAIGALILATVQNLTAYYIDTRWLDAVTYLILIGFLIFRPFGVSGAKIHKADI